MKSKIVIVLLILAIITSCNRNKNLSVIDVNSVKLISLEIVDTTIIAELFYAANVHLIGNFIIMNTFAMRGNDNVFYVYDKRNLKFVGSYLQFGNAGNEIIDLDPYYFYNTSDSTFLTHTNYLNETEFLIRKGGIIMLNSKRISDKVPANIYRIDSAKHVINRMENEKDFEIILQSRDSLNEFSETYLGEYPKFHTDKIKAWERNNLYHKMNITTDKTFLSFYFRVPLIRKYNHDLKLLSEYVLKDKIGYTVRDYDEALENDMLFFNTSKSYKNKVFVVSNKEYLLFNENCELLNRFTIREDIMPNIFTVDDNFIYVLDVNKDPYRLYKIRYN